MAALAGLPDELIANATHILSQLENQKSVVVASESVAPVPVSSVQQIAEQVPLFDVATTDDKIQQLLAQLDQLDILNMTPIDAMNALHTLKKMRQ